MFLYASWLLRLRMSQMGCDVSVNSCSAGRSNRVVCGITFVFGSVASVGAVALPAELDAFDVMSGAGWMVLMLLGFKSP